MLHTPLRQFKEQILNSTREKVSLHIEVSNFPCWTGFNNASQLQFHTGVNELTISTVDVKGASSEWDQNWGTCPCVFSLSA